MRRGFARRRAAACCLAAVTLGAGAGCTSGSASTAAAAATPGGGGGSGSSSPPAARTTPASPVPATALPARALASPGCSGATATGAALGPAGTASVTTGGTPFGVAVTPDGQWAFAVIADATSDQAGTTGPSGEPATRPPLPQSSVEVLRLSGAAAPAPGMTKVRSIPLPASSGGLFAAPAGAAVTPDGKYLLVAAGSGAVVISVARAEAGTAGAVLGSLAAPVLKGAGAGSCAGSVPGTVAGELPGTLTVIDLSRAETDPARSVTATVDAGCQPVRVVTAAAGTQVWVSARASDDVLCFSAARLAADPSRALVATARVGSEPVGLAAVRGGSLLVVADSNRFGASGVSSALSVVSVAAALAGRPAVLGNLHTGLFPRDMAPSPGGTLLVSDNESDQVQAVPTARLPAGG